MPRIGSRPCGRLIFTHPKFKNGQRVLVVRGIRFVGQEGGWVDPPRLLKRCFGTKQRFKCKGPLPEGGWELTPAPARLWPFGLKALVNPLAWEILFSRPPHPEKGPQRGEERASVRLVPCGRRTSHTPKLKWASRARCERYKVRWPGGWVGRSAPPLEPYIKKQPPGWGVVF